MENTATYKDEQLMKEVVGFIELVKCKAVEDNLFNEEFESKLNAFEGMMKLFLQTKKAAGGSLIIE